VLRGFQLPESGAGVIVTTSDRLDQQSLKAITDSSQLKNALHPID
jgi:hypothetical protein